MTTLPKAVADTVADSLTLLLVPCPDENCANDLARRMIRESLAVCAHIMPPHRSLYMWQNAMQETTECTLLLKILHHKSDQAARLLEARHPYDIPCIMTFHVRSNQRYLEWAMQTPNTDTAKTVASPQELQ